MKNFFTNRVPEIQSITNTKDWVYENSMENSVDYNSRGMRSGPMLNSQLWWKDPTWLRKGNHEWPEIKINYHSYKETTKLPERRPDKVVLLSPAENFIFGLNIPRLQN